MNLITLRSLTPPFLNAAGVLPDACLTSAAQAVEIVIVDYTND
jgi:hypothetical protein